MVHKMTSKDQLEKFDLRSRSRPDLNRACCKPVDSPWRDKHNELVLEPVSCFQGLRHRGKRGRVPPIFYVFNIMPMGSAWKESTSNVFRPPPPTIRSWRSPCLFQSKVIAKNCWWPTMMARYLHCHCTGHHGHPWLEWLENTTFSTFYLFRIIL